MENQKETNTNEQPWMQPWTDKDLKTLSEEFNLLKEQWPQMEKQGPGSKIKEVFVWIKNIQLKINPYLIVGVNPRQIMNSVSTFAQQDQSTKETLRQAMKIDLQMKEWKSQAWKDCMKIEEKDHENQKKIINQILEKVIRINQEIKSKDEGQWSVTLNGEIRFKDENQDQKDEEKVKSKVIQDWMTAIDAFKIVKEMIMEEHPMTKPWLEVFLKHSSNIFIKNDLVRFTGAFKHTWPWMQEWMTQELNEGHVNELASSLKTWIRGGLFEGHEDILDEALKWKEINGVKWELNKDEEAFLAAIINKETKQDEEKEYKSVSYILKHPLWAKEGADYTSQVMAELLKNKKTKLAEKLIENKVINIKKIGKTQKAVMKIQKAMMQSAYFNQTETLEWFESHVDWKSWDYPVWGNEKDGLLHSAAQVESIDVMRWLLNQESLKEQIKVKWIKSKWSQWCQEGSIKTIEFMLQECNLIPSQQMINEGLRVSVNHPKVQHALKEWVAKNEAKELMKGIKEEKEIPLKVKRL